MTKAQGATADVFLTALKALPKGQRDAVVVRIARDRVFRRDILDLALIGERRSEPSRPFLSMARHRQLPQERPHSRAFFGARRVPSQQRGAGDR